MSRGIIDFILPIDYVISILPLIVSSLMIPPISYLKGIEDIPEALEPVFSSLYALLPFKFRSLSYVSSLALIHDKNLLKKPFFKSGWISSLFVHSNYNHLLCNLVALFQLAYPMYANHGRFGLYSLFFLGGVVAGYPSPLYDRQYLKLFGYTVLGPNEPPKPKPSSWVDDKSQTLKNTLVEVGKEIGFGRMACYGNSGAVCAFLGYDVVNATTQVTYQVNEAVLKTIKSSSKYMTTKEVLKIFLSNINIFNVFFNSLNIIKGMMYFRLEINNIWSSKRLNGMNINHGGHVQGFLFGLAVGMITEYTPLILIISNIFRY